MIFIKKIILNCLHAYRRKVSIKAAQIDMIDYVKDTTLPALTKREKKAVITFWKRLIPMARPCSLNYHSIYKKIDQFDVTYVPDDIYQPFILPVLNPVHYSVALSNKGLYSFYFHDVMRPYEIVRNIRGCFFDAENGVCSEDQAIEKIMSYKRKFLIKPSIDTSCGKNVRLIENYSSNIIKDLFLEYGENFVCQEFVSQSNQTAQFNPTSLNTFRITTLFLNGRFSILSSVFRCGGLGSIVDNAGAGGIIVGVSIDGSLKEFGYNKNGEICKMSYNNVPFEDTKINAYHRIVDLCKTLHHRIPFCSIVGWDIALNENNLPLLLEVNLKCPGIFYEQMCSGPIFGDRLEEVIEYVSSKIDFR